MFLSSLDEYLEEVNGNYQRKEEHTEKGGEGKVTRGRGEEKRRLMVEETWQAFTLPLCWQQRHKLFAHSSTCIY